MARKSIKGYTEKNYYDNTKFRGITTTSDPLNEGYFNHMVNFDIADTGQSVTPRKGFKTFKLNKPIPNDAIYFKDPSSDYYIFVWLYNGDWSAYKTNFIDEGDVIVETTISSFEPLEKYAQIIYDHYQIQRNVLKAKVGNAIKYINLTYRANDTSYENVSYKGNTVTIDIVDTEDIGSIDTTQRNIASTQSIIPNPMQIISNDVLVNKFPMIYAKTPEGKYAINSVTNLDGLELIPYFELENGDWCYAYEIISSYPGHDNAVYRSELFAMTGTPLDVNYDVFNATKYYYKDTIKYSSYKAYEESLSTLLYDQPFYSFDRVYKSLNVYVFPTYTNSSLGISNNLDEMYDNFYDIYNRAINKNSYEFVEKFPTHIDNISVYLKNNTSYSFFIQPFSELKDADLSFYKWKPTSLFSEYMSLTKSMTISATKLLEYILEHKPDYINFIPFNLSSVYKNEGDPDTYALFSYEADSINDLMFWEIDDTSSRYTGYFLPYVNLDNVVNRTIKVTYDNYALYTNTSLFTYTSYLSATLKEDNVVYKYLKDKRFFYDSFNIILYLFPLHILDNHFDETYDIYNLDLLKVSTNLVSSRQLTYSDHPSYYIEYLTKEPQEILSNTPFIIFNDRIVTWKDNTVYMSEENAYYYFKYTGVYNFPERVVKAIAYKDTVLVFTTQNLYCIYPYEYTESVQDGVDDEGKPKYVQQKVIAYASLPVLYNLMVDEKYADAIQVFNQMVLFYSADGQLFMIKPTASIDSNTRFSIQYFNKSANDILANYDVYINRRLAYYGLPEVSKDDINIRVEVTLNYIKIYYYTNNYTYILIYDVINNYYYTYDTQVVYNIQNFLKTEGYDTIVIESDYNLYFSSVHKNTKNVDLLYNSRTFPIEMELDTGVINLNNHLKKRFRTLHTTYKNIDADDLVYNLEVLVDEVPVYTMHDDIIEVVTNNYETVSKSNEVNLLEDNTVLFKFNDDSLNKIMNHRTNIVSIGKTIRLKTTFKSAGRFKLQGFGLVYKEHQI